MATTLSDIKDLLTPGLHAVTGQYDGMPTKWSQIYGKMMNSTMAVERSVTVRMLGLAAAQAEGEKVLMDTGAGQRFVWNQEHVQIGLAYPITEKAVEDNQYKTEFPASNLNMQESFKQTKEIYAHKVLNLANVYDATVVGDGVALCSTSHPYDGGVWANRPVIDIDLSEAALINALTSIQLNFRNEAGLRIPADARKLIIHPSNEAVAARLTKTEKRPGTNDNDVNAIPYVSGGLPEGYVTSVYLTSPYAWFLKTSIPGLVGFQRKKFSTDMQVDFMTNNLMVKGRERYSFSYRDPRALYASFPTS